MGARRLAGHVWEHTFCWPAGCADAPLRSLGAGTLLYTAFGAPGKTPPPGRASFPPPPCHMTRETETESCSFISWICLGKTCSSARLHASSADPRTTSLIAPGSTPRLSAFLVLPPYLVLSSIRTVTLLMKTVCCHGPSSDREFPGEPLDGWVPVIPHKGGLTPWRGDTRTVAMTPFAEC